MTWRICRIHWIATLPGTSFPRGEIETLRFRSHVRAKGRAKGHGCSRNEKTAEFRGALAEFAAQRQRNINGTQRRPGGARRVADEIRHRVILLLRKPRRILYPEPDQSHATPHRGY